MNGTLDSYVRLALQRHPSVRAAMRRVERLGAQVPQVTSLDDPMFQVAPVGEMAQTAAGEVGLMTGVSQRLPLPGKLRTRGRIAEQEVAMAQADLRAARLQVVADVRRAFWNYYLAGRALEVTGASRPLLEQLAQIAEAQYRVGKRSQADVLRASVELSGVDSELVTLEQRRDTARAMLNQLMDRAPSEPLPTPAVAQPHAALAALDELLRAAAQQNPGIQRLRERVEQQRQRQKLARLNRWPDLIVSANYSAVDDEGLSMAANGRDQWWLGLGVNLPIWFEKYEAAEREALAGVLESVAELSAEQNRVAFQVQDAYLRVQAQRRLVELFGDTILPQAKQAVEASSSGYRAGSVEFLTLVDNWRKLLTFERMQHRAVAELEQALADLHRAVGAEPADVREQESSR